MTGRTIAFDGTFAAVGTRQFGELAGVRKPDGVADTWYCNERKPESELFFLFPKAGGCAMVRMKKRAMPVSTFEYLWIPELPRDEPPK
ncbi:MAG: hypothetical protein ACI89X_002671 [Planctomycetota bacterium]|jgi:hypothetical protein